MLTGSCLCEGVRFEISCELGPVRYCHCSRCRRGTGSAFSANSRVPRAGFSLLQGEALVSEYEQAPSISRAFCSRCGSPLYARLDAEPESIRLRLGTLREDPGLRPVAHVWVGSMAPWFEISDELPRFVEVAPDASGPGAAS
jgi:hypothetical protein